MLKIQMLDSIVSNDEENPPQPQNGRQHVTTAPWSTTTTGGARAQHELFELLERVQCSRLDDQRAVLPPYFSQIHLDFDLLHPDKTNKFHINWAKFITKIKNKKFELKLTDETKALADSIEGLADEDQKLPVQIKLLYHLVPPKGRLNRHQKFSTTECKESIFVNVKTPGDIQRKVEEVATIASARRQTIQPYIIHCTDSGTFNLIIDNIRYVFKSAYKAFDTLFKCYHTFHLTYPKAAYHLYLLIQKCVYTIDTKYDVVPPYILDLISA